MAAFMSTKVSGSSWIRQTFYETLHKLPNLTLADRPILTIALARGRTLKGEASVHEAYRNSIFCPCLRGDEPPQKRFFDAILAGCIPVVLEYETSLESGVVSHYAVGGESVRRTYPWAMGSYEGNDHMGLNYSDLVIVINGTCGVDCLLPTLEELLLHHMDVVRQKQQQLQNMATLFSYGMQQNALTYPDAIASLLVRARHFVWQTELATAGRGFGTK